MTSVGVTGIEVRFDDGIIGAQLSLLRKEREQSINRAAPFAAIQREVCHRAEPGLNDFRSQLCACRGDRAAAAALALILFPHLRVSA